MQGAQPPEIGPAKVRKVKDVRPGQLQGDNHAYKKTGNAPEHGGCDAELDDRVFIERLVERISARQSTSPDTDRYQGKGCQEEEYPGMRFHHWIDRIRSDQ